MVEGQGIAKIKSLQLILGIIFYFFFWPNLTFSAPVTTLLATSNGSERVTPRMSRRSLAIPLRDTQVSASTQVKANPGLPKS